MDTVDDLNFGNLSISQDSTFNPRLTQKDARIAVIKNRLEFVQDEVQRLNRMLQELDKDTSELNTSDVVSDTNTNSDVEREVHSYNEFGPTPSYNETIDLPSYNQSVPGSDINDLSTVHFEDSPIQSENSDSQILQSNLSEPYTLEPSETIFDFSTETPSQLPKHSIKRNRERSIQASRRGSLNLSPPKKFKIDEKPEVIESDANTDEMFSDILKSLKRVKLERKDRKKKKAKKEKKPLDDFDLLMQKMSKVKVSPKKREIEIDPEYKRKLRDRSKVLSPEKKLALEEIKRQLSE
jgi:hypothetical protein